MFLVTSMLASGICRAKASLSWSKSLSNAMTPPWTPDSLRLVAKSAKPRDSTHWITWSLVHTSTSGMKQRELLLYIQQHPSSGITPCPFPRLHTPPSFSTLHTEERSLHLVHHLMQRFMYLSWFQLTPSLFSLPMSERTNKENMSQALYEDKTNSIGNTGNQLKCLLWNPSIKTPLKWGHCLWSQLDRGVYKTTTETRRPL